MSDDELEICIIRYHLNSRQLGMTRRQCEHFARLLEQEIASVKGNCFYALDVSVGVGRQGIVGDAPFGFEAYMINKIASLGFRRC